MKIDMDALLIGINGQPLKIAVGEGLPPETMTLGRTIGAAMFSNLEGEKLNGVQKYDLHCTAKKCASGIVDLSTEDVAAIKDRIGRAFTALVVGPAYDLLDPKAE